MDVCGEVEPDSPKLLELLEPPIDNHTYYARQLHTGLTSAQCSGSAVMPTRSALELPPEIARTIPLMMRSA
jgi:hypothetical protein